MASAFKRPLSRSPNRVLHTENVGMSAETFVCTPDADGCQKSPVTKYLFHSRQIGSWMGSIEVMSVDAVPVVKVEHLKELLPAQRSPRTHGPRSDSC